MIVPFNDYNQLIPSPDTWDIIGTITPQFGALALRNGWKIIECMEEQSPEQVLVDFCFHDRIRVYDDYAMTIKTNVGGGGIWSSSTKNPDIALYQYPRGCNKGGILNGDISPTVTSNSWQHNLFIVECEQ